MVREGSRASWGALVAVALVLGSASACTGDGEATSAGEKAAPFDETEFWASLPRPADAEGSEVGEEFDEGFTTALVEPALFDFYSGWLSEHGWQQQAPTEAMASLPHQVWQKDGLKLLIELGGLNEQGRTIVRLQLVGE